MNLSVSQEVRATLQVYGKENAGDINKGKLKQIPLSSPLITGQLHVIGSLFVVVKYIQLAPPSDKSPDHGPVAFREFTRRALSIYNFDATTFATHGHWDVI